MFLIEKRQATFCFPTEILIILLKVIHPPPPLALQNRLMNAKGLLGLEKLSKSSSSIKNVKLFEIICNIAMEKNKSWTWKGTQLFKWEGN